jgi:hypothetical protein
MSGFCFLSDAISLLHGHANFKGKASIQRPGGSVGQGAGSAANKNDAEETSGINSSASACIVVGGETRSKFV